MNDCINLFDKGALVNLQISTWSGRKMLSLQDMKAMGINTDALPRDVVNLGRKLLVAKTDLKYISKIESKARSYLDKYSFPFGLSYAHFVPITVLKEVEEKLKEFKKEFDERVDYFINKFEDAKTVLHEKHPDFWNKCLKQHYPPNPQSLKAKYNFRWFIFKVSGFDTEEASVTEMVAQQQVQDERTKELKEQMQTEVSDFVSSYIKTMREETIDFCNLLQARVEGKPYGDEEESKKLTGRAISYFKKHIDKFGQMNIFGDDEINKMLNEFSSNYLDFGITPKDFENSDVQRSVSMALTKIKEKAAMENGDTSQFIEGVRRKITI